MTQPPHATPQFDTLPYAIERRVLADIPCLIERPLDVMRGLAIVFHGATAAKEGNLGIFTKLISGGLAVVLPDAFGHGERREAGFTPEVIGYRNYVWGCAAQTSLEAGALLDALHEQFGDVPVSVIGISMGGYVAQFVTLREKRVRRVVVLSSGGEWHDPELTLPQAGEFVAAHRPLDHADAAPPTDLLLLHGDADPVFPMPGFEAITSAYKHAYARAGRPDLFHTRVYRGVGHYTAPQMRDVAVRFLLERP